MGNASDGEIIAAIRYGEAQRTRRRDSEVEARGYLRVTTAPPTWNPQADPTGWRLHIVQGAPMEPTEALRWRRAICGVLPAHGWGLDLFIDQECARCARAFAKLPTPAENGASVAVAKQRASALPATDAPLPLPTNKPEER